MEITAAEPPGVGHRADYYEESGALRDMVANHLMQLLALTAMEAPVASPARYAYAAGRFPSAGEAT